MSHKNSLMIIGSISNPERRIAAAKDEIILIDMSMTSADTQRKIKTALNYKEKYLDIIDQAEQEIRERDEMAPLSRKQAAGEELPADPLQAVKAILIERGEYAEIQHDTIFTGSEYYVIKLIGQNMLSVVNADGLPVFGSKLPGDIVRYLMASTEAERDREHKRRREIEERAERDRLERLEQQLAAPIKPFPFMFRTTKGLEIKVGDVMPAEDGGERDFVQVTKINEVTFDGSRLKIIGLCKPVEGEGRA